MKAKHLLTAVAIVISGQAIAGELQFEKIWETKIDGFYGSFPTNSTLYTRQKEVYGQNLFVGLRTAYSLQTNNTYRAMLIDTESGALLGATEFEFCGFSPSPKNSYFNGEVLRINYRAAVDGRLANYTNLYFTVENQELVPFDHSSDPDGLIWRADASVSRSKNIYHALNGDVLTRYKLKKNDCRPRIKASESGMNGANYVLSWSSEEGELYRVQQSSNLVDWVDTDVTLSGTGSKMNWADPVKEKACYYRVVVEAQEAVEEEEE